VLGPFGCGKDLADVSAMDFARSAERDIDAFCRQGFGALIAKLGDGLPVQLAAPATRIDLTSRGGVEIETSRGRLTARGVIVTVSTGVLAAGKIKFVPDLPKRQIDAVNILRLGSYDRTWARAARQSAGAAGGQACSKSAARAPPQFWAMFQARHCARST
jgi:hypothetical protein